MSESNVQESGGKAPDEGRVVDDSELVAARRQKLRFLRDELGVEPYGGRVEDLSTLVDAREAFDQAAHDAREADPEAEDGRPRRIVAGRVMQHRDMGKLVFMTLRDHTGDLQVSVSKAECAPEMFRLAKKLDYGDVVVAGGPIGKTRKGETCVWADRVEIHAKPPSGRAMILVGSGLRSKRPGIPTGRLFAWSSLTRSSSMSRSVRRVLASKIDTLPSCMLVTIARAPSGVKQTSTGIAPQANSTRSLRVSRSMMEIELVSAFVTQISSASGWSAIPRGPPPASMLRTRRMRPISTTLTVPDSLFAT